MFCKNCGNALMDGAAFCGACGTPVVANVEEPVKATVEVEVPEVEIPVEEVVEPTPVVEAAPVVEPTPVVASTPVQETVAQPSAPAYVAPALQLPTERKMWKMIVFGFLTCGIYPIVIYAKMADELNMAASRYDGERTTNYYVATILTACTFGIYGLYWMHALSARIGTEVRRRGYEYKFGAGTYWGWNILGSLILVGPFIYLHKLTKCMNAINESYNYYG